ncbi:hypothetical protein QNZ79_004721 [Vibrio parahaemolyticus]|nr:hypothetical protein [Vibrio parahaemolyticus]
MQKIITETLAALDCEFHHNELAYLALTSKVEAPIRDRWAYSLYKQLNNYGITVSREWKRTDLALIERGNPLALVELKAMYSFDAALDPNEVGGFTDAMAKDEVKAAKLAQSNTSIYTVLLATHPHKLVTDLSGVVKYDSGINKALLKFEGEQGVKSAALDAVDRKLAGKNVVAHGELCGGKAFNTAVSVIYWVIRA